MYLTSLHSITIFIKCCEIGNSQQGKNMCRQVLESQFSYHIGYISLSHLNGSEVMSQIMRYVANEVCNRPDQQP
jgi:hypothetical protein